LFLPLTKVRTAAGTHNDTYAESYHRDFFKRWSEGVPPEKCSEGTEGHNTASIGGFVTLPPVMFSAMARSASDAAAVKDTVRRHLKLTHDSSKLATFSDIYCDLMLDVVRGADLRSAVSAISKGKLGFDVDALVAKNTDDTQVSYTTLLGPGLPFPRLRPVLHPLTFSFSFFAGSRPCAWVSMLY
jgi:hypothetical protein